MFDHIGAGYRRRGALIDTNLFLLLLVGRYDIGKLDRFRGTKKYGVKVFLLLEELVSLFSRLYTTSNVATELDNLSRQVNSGEWAGISATLSKILSPIVEETFPSLQLVNHRLHAQVGATDCSIIEMSDRGLFIITDDLPLTIELEKRRRAVLNLSRYIL